MRISFLFLICSLLAFSLRAQDTSKTNADGPHIYLIQTIDGTKLTGTFVSEDEQWIIFKTSSFGELSVLKSRIKRLKRLDASDFRNGEYWFKDPALDHYVLGPSSFCLHRGEVGYQNAYLFGQGINIGITERFSIGAGTELASPLSERSLPGLFFLNTKFGFQLAPKLRVATGLIYLNTTISYSDAYRCQFAVAYGLITAGSAANNFTVGIGWGYHSYWTEDYFSYETGADNGAMAKPVITLGGTARVSKHCALMTESWVFPIRYLATNYYAQSQQIYYEYNFLLSYGVRFMNDHLSVDLGLINNTELYRAFIVGVPYIGMALKFGGKKIDNDREWLLQGKR